MENPKASQSVLFEQLVLQTVFGEDPYCYRFPTLKKQNVVDRQPSTTAKRLEKNPFTGQVFPIQRNAGSSSEHRRFDRMESQPEIPAKSECDDFCWWRPPSKSIFVKYLENSSMHGLKYIAQGRRHFSERIFWAVSFLISLATAVYLINKVWTRYHESPVYVSFNPKEIHIYEIPFPAITICNMDIISKDIINQLNVRARKREDDPMAIKAKAELQYANNICKTSQSFAKRVGFASSRGSLPVAEDSELFSNSSTSSKNVSLDIAKFLMKKTTPCNEMIRRCIWNQKVVDCSSIFSPVVIDLGKCCTFNMLPKSLLLSPLMQVEEGLPIPQNVTPGMRVPRKVAQKIREKRAWEKWNYLTGFFLDPDIQRPRRQTRAGASYGLSILLDANTKRYFCPSSDSQGFRMLLHTPLEFPQVKDYGIAIGLQREINVGIHPELTMAENIRRLTTRECIFEDEKNLDFFQPYAYKNCALECTAKIVEKKCACVNYEMPRFPSTRLCSADPSDPDQQCVQDTKKVLNVNFTKYCGECKSLCSELNYVPELNWAELQNSSILWGDYSADDRPPDWWENKLSVVHVYFKMPVFVPSIRRELYAVTDLIASTGNILCLCLGFSILSGVELIYFFTFRPCWKQVRKETTEKSKGNNNNDTKVIVVGKKQPKQPQNPHYRHPSRPSSNFPGRHRNRSEIGVRDEIEMTHKIMNIHVQPNLAHSRNMYIPFELPHEPLLNTYANPAAGSSSNERFAEYERRRGHLKQY